MIVWWGLILAFAETSWSMLFKMKDTGEAMCVRANWMPQMLSQGIGVRLVD